MWSERLRVDAALGLHPVAELAEGLLGFGVPAGERGQEAEDEGESEQERDVPELRRLLRPREHCGHKRHERQADGHGDDEHLAGGAVGARVAQPVAEVREVSGRDVADDLADGVGVSAMSAISGQAPFFGGSPPGRVCCCGGLTGFCQPPPFRCPSPGRGAGRWLGGGDAGRFSLVTASSPGSGR